MKNNITNEDLVMEMQIRTLECDGGLLPCITEHLGHAGRIPCTRCYLKGSTNSSETTY